MDEELRPLKKIECTNINERGLSMLCDIVLIFKQIKDILKVEIIKKWNVNKLIKYNIVMPIIQYTDKNNKTGSLNVSEFPDECPMCHKGIKPILFGKAFWSSINAKMQAIFICPREECYRVFIGFYAEAMGQYFLSHLRPINIVEKDFPDTIKSISSNFPKIYNQSHGAEQLKLDEVCGSGYRKALEFLIKDYLLDQTKDEEEKKKIKKEFLGQCIKTRIDNPKLQLVAERATWLGNDETHYERRWKDKDIEDLKNLIQLTVNWIDTEQLTKEILKDMPKGKIKSESNQSLEEKKKNQELENK